MSLVEFPPHLLSEPVERWAEWLFDRRAKADNPNGELFEADCDYLSGYGFDDPEHLLLNGLADLHEHYVEWANRYSAPQLSQGLWALFSYPCFLGPLFFDADLPLAPRERAMRSLVVPYRTYVAGWSPKEEMPHGWFMLWHMILRDGDHGRMDDVALDCLQQILSLPDERCQSAALHGLNHLDHPDRRAVVQRWIDAHRNEEWNWKWVESCRDGKAM